jgi:hypothetical protein
MIITMSQTMHVPVQEQVRCWPKGEALHPHREQLIPDLQRYARCFNVEQDFQNSLTKITRHIKVKAPITSVQSEVQQILTFLQAPLMPLPSRSDVLPSAALNITGIKQQLRNTLVMTAEGFAPGEIISNLCTSQ